MVGPPRWDRNSAVAVAVADAAVADLAADLRALPYTTDAVGDLLGDVATAALEREQAEPARRRLAHVLHDAGAPGSQRALAAVVSCWMLGDPVPTATLDAALPSLTAAGAAELNLGWIRDEDFHPVVDLSPYSTDDLGAVWVASDQTALQTRATLPSWHVLGIGRASMTLAGNVIRRPVAQALDLGTGCGIQTLHLLAHADHVTATDLSVRALEFTAFNLALNAEALGLDLSLTEAGGLDGQPPGTRGGFPLTLGGRVTLLRGDLLEPVAGRRFDLVVSNPPYVITPRSGSEPDRFTGEVGDGINTYRDGGRPGDRLLAELVATLPDHLEPGGMAQMLGNWEIHGTWDDTSGHTMEGTPDRVTGAASPQLPGWDVRPRSWVPSGVDAWFIQRDLLDPAGYAETWLQDSSEQLDPGRYTAGYRRYLEDFGERGVAAVGFGYVWLRRPAAPRAGRLRTEVLESELQQPLGPAWGEAVDRWDLVAGDAGDAGDLAALRALHVTLPGDVTEERHQRFGSDHPEIILARQGGGFRRTAHVDTATAGFLSAADGEFSVGQLTSAVAGLLDLDEVGEQALVAAVAELLMDGFLTVTAPIPSRM
ncbi:methyltransferase [Cellulosimicrobium funkei]|nr:methyltransferase [Cellulosimicrobium funkei]